MIHTGAAVAAGMSQGRLTPHDKVKLDCTKVRVMASSASLCLPSIPPFPSISLPPSPHPPSVPLPGSPSLCVHVSAYPYPCVSVSVCVETEGCDVLLISVLLKTVT